MDQNLPDSFEVFAITTVFAAIIEKKKIDTKMGMLREQRRQDGEFKIFEL